MEIATHGLHRAPDTAGEPSASAPPRQPPARLKVRADFLRVGKGLRFHTTTFSLQAAPRPRLDGGGAAAGARFGLTVTKKVGGAVERNRIRRRLREALRVAPPLAARADFDYVVLARREALTAPFPTLIGELGQALRRIHEPRRKAQRPAAGAPGAGQSVAALAVRPADLHLLQSAVRPAFEANARDRDGIPDTDQ